MLSTYDKLDEANSEHKTPTKSKNSLRCSFNSKKGYVNDNAVRIRGGLLNILVMFMLIQNITDPIFIMYCSGAVLLWDMFCAVIFGLTLFAPFSFIAILLARSTPPIWIAIIPKRFCWTLGSILIIISIISVTSRFWRIPLGTFMILTWTESVGVCIGSFFWDHFLNKCARNKEKDTQKVAPVDHHWPDDSFLEFKNKYIERLNKCRTKTHKRNKISELYFLSPYKGCEESLLPTHKAHKPCFSPLHNSECTSRISLSSGRNLLSFASHRDLLAPNQGNITRRLSQKEDIKTICSNDLTISVTGNGSERKEWESPGKLDRRESSINGLLKSEIETLPQLKEWEFLHDNSTPDYKSKYADFLKKNSLFNKTEEDHKILRMTEYAELDKQKIIYLDYTAGGITAHSQLDQIHSMLTSNYLGNPHSACPTSLQSSFLLSSTRTTVLEFFNAPEHMYDVIFTQNASGALKIVGESFRFLSSSRLLVLSDNHNSVLGTIQYARSRGVTDVIILPLGHDLTLDPAILFKELARINRKIPNLFCYPAQSNFSGAKHSLEWIRTAHDQGWYVLCDIAAYVPTSKFDLHVHQPDFASMSFYKMFGFPTGIGALLVKKSCYPLLQKNAFMGGTVKFVSIQQNDVIPILEDGSAIFEDGTVNYMCIPAIKIGLHFIQSVGMETISLRVKTFTQYLLHELLSIKYPNGRNLVMIQGPQTIQNRGGTLSMVFLFPDGTEMVMKAVEFRANHANINVRVGCFCNPGAAMQGMKMTKVLQSFNGNSRLSEILNSFYPRSFGALRCSIGIATSFHDVYRFVLFAKQFLDEEKVKTWMLEYWQSCKPILSVC